MQHPFPRLLPPTFFACPSLNGNCPPRRSRSDRRFLIQESSSIHFHERTKRSVILIRSNVTRLYRYLSWHSAPIRILLTGVITIDDEATTWWTEPHNNSSPPLLTNPIEFSSPIVSYRFGNKKNPSQLIPCFCFSSVKLHSNDWSSHFFSLSFERVRFLFFFFFFQETTMIISRVYNYEEEEEEERSINPLSQQLCLVHYAGLF